MITTDQTAEMIFFDLMDKHRKILCSEDKRDNHEYLPRDRAYSRAFVSLGSNYHSKSISIDIDNNDIDTVTSIMQKFNIPSPTLTIETPRGYHLHWVLDVAVSVKNTAGFEYLKSIQRTLSYLLNSDTQALGHHRLWRTIDGAEYYFTETLYELDDFKELLQHAPKLSKHEKSLIIDFTQVLEGERHQSLFHYTRNFAYKHYKNKELLEVISSEAIIKNSQMPKPLPEKQVLAMCKSIERWVSEKYRRTVTNSDTITEFNRNLARMKADKTQKSILNGILQLLISMRTVRDIRKASARVMSKIVGVSRPSYTKYKDRVLDFILANTKIYKQKITDFFTDLQLTFSIEQLIVPIPLLINTGENDYNVTHNWNRFGVPQDRRVSDEE